MIHSYDEFDEVLRQALTGIKDIEGNAVPVRYGVPQATVVEQGIVPSIILTRFDERVDRARGYDFGLRYQWSEEDEVYHQKEIAYPVTLSYQLDLYSHLQREMLHLERQTFARLPRWRGFLLDPDGYTVRFELTDTQDLSEDVKTQRLFRRALTFDFRVWMEEEETEPIEVKDVRHIELDICDQAMEG